MVGAALSLTVLSFTGHPGGQGVVQIVDNILNILDAHAQPDEIRGNAGGLLLASPSCSWVVEAG
jgi:hypothetical protein